MAIASGYMDSVIVMGAEKMTDTSMPKTTAADADFEGDPGVSFVSLNALIMQRYLYKHRWKHTDFAQFSINAHENALKNPNAWLHDLRPDQSTGRVTYWRRSGDAGIGAAREFEIQWY